MKLFLILNKTATDRRLILKIRLKQLEFLRHIMRKEDLKKGKRYEVKRDKGRRRLN